MRIIKNRKGQFIVIAVMMIALMIVSIGAIMYRAGTYYRQEQWEEYITIVEHVRLGTIRLAEISLANYTASGNNSTLKDNLDQWQNDLRKAYPGYGVILTYNLADGTNINYSQGLASHWNETVSYSAASATFDLNITSVGLEGYKFMATAFLNLTILNVDALSSVITLAVKGEDGMPIKDLKKGNFQVDGLNITSVTSSYDPTYFLVYIIKCDGSIPESVPVAVRDQRGIIVIAKS
ncbi:MAG: hypothetical protein OEY90_03980 [Candidatus Bathyarchaeota archaeon]|nr:hypothetical protein [Candidatus Bathyarchaeota archaeon]